MSVSQIVWRFRDGKAGHERQTAGLCNALATRRAITVCDIDARACRAPFLAWLRSTFPPGIALPQPRLLVGAGHACQWPMLAARRAWGGHTVYCMKPGIPSRLFDLCLIPEHDAPRRCGWIEPTTGVLNDLAPGVARRPARTLILIGGPSRHHRWDEAGVLQQIASVVYGSRDREFVISDSRRTPPSTRAKLQAFAGCDVEVVAATAVPPAWLIDTLHDVGQVWVTADSASMLFEALTVGVAVGVLDVPPRRDDRITRLAKGLAATGLVTLFDDWRQGSALRPPPHLLHEAARCADLVAARWLA